MRRVPSFRTVKVTGPTAGPIVHGRVSEGLRARVIIASRKSHHQCANRSSRSGATTDCVPPTGIPRREDPCSVGSDALAPPLVTVLLNQRGIGEPAPIKTA